MNVPHFLVGIACLFVVTSQAVSKKVKHNPLVGIWQSSQPENGSWDIETENYGPIYRIYNTDGTFSSIANFGASNDKSIILQQGTYKLLTDSTYKENLSYNVLPISHESIKYFIDKYDRKTVMSLLFWNSTHNMEVISLYEKVEMLLEEEIEILREKMESGESYEED